MKYRITIPLVVAGAIVGGVATAIAMMAGGGGTSGSSAEWPDYYSATSLARDSQAIVVAEFLSERDERVEIPSPVEEDPGVYRDDILRTYQVVEVLRGDIAAGEEIETWRSRGIDDTTGGGRSQSFENPDVEEGQRYVLFLMEFERNDEPIWGPVGEPAIAELDGEELRIIVTDRYRETAAEHGREDPESAAGFQVSLPELRDIVEEDEDAVGP